MMKYKILKRKVGINGTDYYRGDEVELSEDLAMKYKDDLELLDKPVASKPKKKKSYKRYEEE